MLRTIKLKVGILKSEFQFCNWPWPWLGANHLTSQEPNLLTSWMSMWCLVFTRLFPALHIYKDPTVPSTTALPTHTAHMSQPSVLCHHFPCTHTPHSPRPMLLVGSLLHLLDGVYGKTHSPSPLAPQVLVLSWNHLLLHVQWAIFSIPSKSSSRYFPPRNWDYPELLSIHVKVSECVME